MPLSIDDIRFMPREVPRDPLHEEIVEGLVTGDLIETQVAPMFEIPGVGFHRALYTLTLHLAEYRKAGRQSFIIPPGMQKALANTSLAEVRPRDIKVPYRSQYIALPDCDAYLWGGATTGWHRVAGAFLRYVQGEDRRYADRTEKAPPNDPGLVYLYLWGEENEKSTGPGDDASMWFAFDLHDMQQSGEDLSAYFRNLLNDPDREVTIDEMSPMAEKMGIITHMPREGGEGEKAREGVVAAIRMIFNALLYLDSQNPEVETDPTSLDSLRQRAALTAQLDRIKNPKKKKARVLRRRRDDLPLDTVVWVGRSISMGETSEGATGSPQREHWVRGHWWPRRDTIQQRVEEAERVAHAHGLVCEAQKVEIQTASVGKVAPLLPAAGEQRTAHMEALAAVEELRGTLNAKRRWVKPYKKGGKSKKAPVRSHVYPLPER
jgi:hypothetical protein